MLEEAYQVCSFDLASVYVKGDIFHNAFYSGVLLHGLLCQVYAVAWEFGSHLELKG